MLERIKIEGYKSIKTAEITLKPLNILVGSNGAGKTNFLSFFKLINDLYEKRLKTVSIEKGVSSLTHRNANSEEVSDHNQIMGHLYFNDYDYSFTLKQSNGHNLFVEHEEVSNRNVLDGASFSNKGVPESGVKTLGSALGVYLDSYKIHKFNGGEAGSPLRSIALIDDNRRLKEDGRNLPAYLNYLQIKHPRQFDRIEKCLKSTMPFFDRFNLNPDPLNKENIKLNWIAKGDQNSCYDATYLSNGALRFMALTTLLLQPDLPKTVIIDEVESGLDSIAIGALSSLLKLASQNGSQIIASTQSMDLVNMFETENIIAVDNDGVQSSFHKSKGKELAEWMGYYPRGGQWKLKLEDGFSIEDGLSIGTSM